jgi:hypothetical protein
MTNTTHLISAVAISTNKLLAIKHPTVIETKAGSLVKPTKSNHITPSLRFLATIVFFRCFSANF